ncbi:hypothetical protein [Kitasatospora sp. NPDC001683]
MISSIRVGVAAGQRREMRHWLLVVFEPMGSLYEVPAGEHLTVRFTARSGDGGAVDHRAGTPRSALGLPARWPREPRRARRST